MLPFSFSLPLVSNSCVKDVAHTWFSSITLALFKMEKFDTALNYREYYYCIILQNPNSHCKMLSFLCGVRDCVLMHLGSENLRTLASVFRAMHRSRNRQVSLYSICGHFGTSQKDANSLQTFRRPFPFITVRGFPLVEALGINFLKSIPMYPHIRTQHVSQSLLQRC